MIPCKFHGLSVKDVNTFLPVSIAVYQSSTSPTWSTRPTTGCRARSESPQSLKDVDSFSASLYSSLPVLCIFYLLLGKQDQWLGAEQDRNLSLKDVDTFSTSLHSSLLVLHISYLEHKANKQECRVRSTSPWAHRNFFQQLSRDQNAHSFGMSNATTASPKPSFRASWRVCDAVVSRGNAGWTIPTSAHSCLCRNCSQRPAEKTGRGALSPPPPTN